MHRKPKDIYSKIAEKTEQIKSTKEKLLTYENELIQLNKERESLDNEKEKRQKNYIAYLWCL